MTKKFLTAGLIASTLSGSVLATSSSAQAGGYWHHGHHGHYWGGAAAAGVLGALAVGAIAANSYGGGECYITRQPVTDAWGNFLYTRRVRVCD
ncbi:MAG: hypothetical protein C3F11_02300 [Methylocystaceae bacterium]|nr:MAG: hypothetical protein C3F11_02300 [Methylocystaceae bacterium]